MTVLQFISSIQWPVFLLLLCLGGRAVWRRSSSETRAAIRDFILRGGWRVEAGSVKIAFDPEDTAKAAATATAPDSELQQRPTADGEGTGASPEQVQQLRREAVEDIMRQSAEWGWTMAQMGFKSAPVPMIDWDGDRPVIRLGLGDMAARHSAMVRHWNIHHGPGHADGGQSAS